MRVCIYLRNSLVNEIMKNTGMHSPATAVRRILLDLLARHGDEPLRTLARAELLEEGG